jgi:hypothetical protein
MLVLDAALGCRKLGIDAACEAVLGDTVNQVTTQHQEAALREALSLGNELGASLGTCSISTVSNSRGKEQEEQLSDALSTPGPLANSSVRSRWARPPSETQMPAWTGIGSVLRTGRSPGRIPAGPGD